MANSWFRFYAEFEDDPKVQMLSEPMQRRLAMLFCQRCKGEKRTEIQMAFKWRISLEEMAETKRVFVENGFIDERWNLANWDKRQYISDSSTLRTRKFKEKQKAQQKSVQEQAGTFPIVPGEQSGTPPDTEQIQKEELTLLSSAPTIRAEEFANIWNRKRGQLPKVEKFTDSRRKKLKTRLGEGLTIERFVEAIECCKTKPFLRGVNDSGWTATFDWLIENSTNLEKSIMNPYGLSTANGNGHKPKTQYELDRESQLAERQLLLEKVQ